MALMPPYVVKAGHVASSDARTRETDSIYSWEDLRALWSYLTTTFYSLATVIFILLHANYVHFLPVQLKSGISRSSPGPGRAETSKGVVS